MYTSNFLHTKLQLLKQIENYFQVQYGVQDLSLQKKHLSGYKYNLYAIYNFKSIGQLAYKTRFYSETVPKISYTRTPSTHQS